MCIYIAFLNSFRTSKIRLHLARAADGAINRDNKREPTTRLGSSTTIFKCIHHATILEICTTIWKRASGAHFCRVARMAIDQFWISEKYGLLQKQIDWSEYIQNASSKLYLVGQNNGGDVVPKHRRQHTIRSRNLAECEWGIACNVSNWRRFAKENTSLCVHLGKKENCCQVCISVCVLQTCHGCLTKKRKSGSFCESRCPATVTNNWRSGRRGNFKHFVSGVFRSIRAEGLSFVYKTADLEKCLHHVERPFFCWSQSCRHTKINFGKFDNPWTCEQQFVFAGKSRIQPIWDNLSWRWSRSTTISVLVVSAS